MNVTQNSLQSSLLFAVLALAAPALCAEKEIDASRPNILFAIADDWRWPQAGAYGDPVVKTPAFDRIAREGLLFHNAFVSSPSCTPCRSAILTGQWHWRLDEAANLWSTLPAKFPVYPLMLEKAGYHIGHTRKAWGPGRNSVGGRTKGPAGPTFRNFAAFISSRPKVKPFYDLAFAKRPAEELYDLKKDPAQLKNIAGAPGYAAVKKKLAAQLMSDLKSTADPRALGGAERFDRYPYYGGGRRRPPGKKPRSRKKAA